MKVVSMSTILETDEGFFFVVHAPGQDPIVMWREDALWREDPSRFGIGGPFDTQQEAQTACAAEMERMTKAMNEKRRLQ